jgi:hypothetical protein
MKKIIVLTAACFCFLFSCKKDKGKQFPPEPQIYYQSTTPNTVNFLDTTSMTTVTFRFTDGDGDIGMDKSDTLKSIFIRDSRDTTAGDSSYAFPFPYLADNIRPEGGLEGNVTLHIGRQYYRVWDSAHTAARKDTMVWSIFIKDMAGHKSNVITSDTIYIQY